jgi:TrmH family RNA methyltransferase
MRYLKINLCPSVSIRGSNIGVFISSNSRSANYAGGMSAPEWRKCIHLIQELSVPRARRRSGLFTLEGYRSLERAFRNGAPLESVLVSETVIAGGNERNARVVEEANRLGVPLHAAPDDVVSELTGGRGLGDVFAVLRRPPEPKLEELIRPEGRTLLVVGWNLGDPGNTGAVIRSALAAGAAGFVAVGTTDPWHPKAVRTSMGSLFALPILDCPDAEEGWLSSLKESGFETVASVCRDAEPLNDIKRVAPRTALVMGSEAFGLPDELAARMDRRVTIPMPGGVDSYSINAATAVLAYTLMQLPQHDVSLT